MKITVEQLNKVFRDFEPDLIQDITNNAILKEVAIGEIVMRTGQHLSSAMILINGTLKIYREGDEGGEFFLYYLNPGEACAMSLTCLNHQEKSQVTAVAVEQTTILFIPMTKVNEWIRIYRSWSDFVIHTYRKRFEDALLVLDNVAFRGMDERLEFYLKKQVENCGCNDLQINHQTIANDLNSSREVISRLLKKMEQRGLLILHRNHIEFLGREF
jgi:CRP/FNR family transcriptional regulator